MLSALIILSGVAFIYFVTQKKKSLFSSYLTSIIFFSLVKVSAMFIQVSYITDNRFFLYIIYYITIFIGAVASFIFAYEYTKNSIQKYISQNVFYSTLSLIVLFFIAKLIMQDHANDNIIFSIELSAFVLEYSKFDKLIFFNFIYLTFIISFIFYIIHLLQIAKSIDKKNILRTVLFSKNNRVYFTKIYIVALIPYSIYFVMEATIHSTFNNSLISSNFSMISFLVYIYLLMYVFFKDKTEFKKFSMPIVILSMTLICTVIFFTSIILRNYVSSMFRNKIFYDSEIIERNIKLGITDNQYFENIDFINIDFIIEKNNKHNTSKIIYIKIDNYRLNSNIHINLENAVLVKPYNKYFIINLLRPRKKISLDDIFLIENINIGSKTFKYGISYLEVRKILSDLYYPYLILYFIIISIIAYVFLFVIIKPMKKSFKIILNAQKQFISDHNIRKIKEVKSKDEFSYLLESFYFMTINIRRNMANIKKNKYKIDNYNKNLKHIVNQQIEELEIAYKELKQDEKNLQLNIEIALELQNAMLPEISNLENIEYYMTENKIQHITTEIFSTTRINENHLRLYSMSMNKNDIASAMFAIIMKIEYDNITTLYKNPSDVLREINKIFIKNKYNTYLFARCILVDIYFDRPQIIYSSSAFPAGYILSNKNSLIDIIPTQIEMIGISEKQTFFDKTIDVNYNDKFMLINDEMSKVYDNNKVVNILTNTLDKDIKEIIYCIEKDFKQTFEAENVHTYFIGINIDNKKGDSQ